MPRLRGGMKGYEMNIAEAKQQVKDAVEAYYAKDEFGMYRIETGQQRPIFLIGAPGIGKTAIMTQIAEELGIGLVSYSMTHHTRQSALGLPFIVHREFEGFEYDASEYTMSEIVSAMYDYMRDTGIHRGILFLDEINCVSETLYPSMLQFLQFKTFGRHAIPDDWIVVCAGNPPEYNKSVHDFDVVTLDRLRKIEVEPSYEAWRTYAQNAGVHPAILSFLEVKQDCFYRVETTPEGKVFVTARGWEDLSRIIILFESLDKKVDQQLIGQYLQLPEIAERFALYYDLFKKYRSDYQVADILAGSPPEEVFDRAKKASFDERLALVGLLVDAISHGASKTRADENALQGLRDILREVKPKLVDEGAAVDEVLGAQIDAIQEKMAQAKKEKAAGKTHSSAEMRKSAAVAARLKELESACMQEGATRGTEAFDVIQERYGKLVEELQADVEEVQSQMAGAYAFVDEVFDPAREVMIFTTELTARKATMSFINRFGSDAYYDHNEDLQVSSQRERLLERIKELGPQTPVLKVTEV